MNSKIIFGTAIAIFTCSILLAQKPVFYKTWAFVKHETRGNVFVDENGNAVDDGQATKYLVYAEMAQQKKPGVTMAWVNGKAYDVTTTQIKKPTVLAGQRNDDETKVTITPTKGNSLWLLEFTNTITGVAVPAAYKKQISKGQVLLQTQLGGKKYFILIPVPVALKPATFGKTNVGKKDESVLIVLKF